MDKKIKIDFINKVIEVEGDSEFINEKIDWFVKYMSENEQNSQTYSHIAEQMVARTEPGNAQDEVMSIFGIPLEKLNYIVHIKGNEFKFIVQSKRLKGSRAEIQVHLALIYCGVCEYLNRETNTKELRQICENYKCLDGNFAANLKRDGYFSVEKGINSEIVLTMPGKDALQDYIKELIEGMDD